MRVLHRILVAVAFFSLTATTLADETKPILVVAMRGHQNLIDDLSFVGSSIAFQAKDREKLGKKFVNGSINSFLRKLLEKDEFDIQEMPGIDPQRPWGFTVLTDEVNIVPMAFLPITGLEAYLEVVKKYNGDRVQETEDGLYEINLTDTETVFIKTEGDWGFIAQGPDNLATLPNPDEILGDLPSKYDLGMRINFQEIPEFLRDMVVDSSDRLAEILPIANVQGPLGILGEEPGELLNMMLTQIDQLTIGGSIDAENENISFEVTVKPVEGSDVERHFATLPEATTRFGNLVDPDSAIMMHVTIAAMDDHTMKLAKKSIDDYHQQVMAAIEAAEEVGTDREREVFGELLTSLHEITTASIETRGVDMAMRMTGKSGKYTLVAATKVADREPVDAMVQRIAELAQGDPGFETVKLQVAEQDGVAIHSFKMTASGDQEDSKGVSMMQALFGDSIEMHIAVGEDAFFFALGVDGLEQLKAAMKLEEKLVPPMEAVIDFESIADILAVSVGDNQQIQLAMVVMKMQLASADSHLSLSLNPSSDGMVFQGKAQKAIVKVIAIAFPLLQDTILEQLKSGDGALGLPSIPGL